MAGKYVKDGAKIKCSLCSKPEGTLKVTSNGIKLQDKPWATMADKGKQNLLFQGNCMKFSNNPPPCAGVISPTQWQNTAMGVAIDGKSPLLESSSIICSVGGVPITITDTQQKSVPTNLSGLLQTEAPVPKPLKETEPEIIDAYWVDKDMNKETTLNHEERARIRIITENAQGRKITLKVYESDFGPMNDDFVYEYEWNLQNKDAILSFNVTPDMFSKGEEDLVHFYFTLQIEDQDEEVFCNSDSEYLKVHLVRYIPTIMEKNGWNIAARLQNQWFNGESNNNPFKAKPDVDTIKMDWVLKFPRIREYYQRILNEKIWDTPEARNSLLTEIGDMIEDNIIREVPTKEKVKITFGDFSREVIKNDDNTYTIFVEKYYYQQLRYEITPLDALFSEPVDDMFASLANFNFRITAKGNIIYQSEDEYKLEITKIGIFIRDSYDFNGDQKLGYWNPKTNYAGKIFSKGYKITNESYRNWRQDHPDKGHDFLIFSDIREEEVYSIFSVPNPIIQKWKKQLKT